MSRLLCVALRMGAFGCYTTSTTSTTWTEAPPTATVGMRGRVQYVREIVHRTEGNQAGGAIAGAIIGGALFHGSAPSTLFGAAAGAATGAALSSGRNEERAYEVHVVFEDGSQGIFAYRGYSPFVPGQPVVITPGGLAPE